MRHILLIGKPCCGKGTQAELLKPYGFEHISTGALYRDAKKRDDPVVRPYVAHVDEGGLLPDNILFYLFNGRIEAIGKNKRYVLDGAIRTIAQAKIGLEKGLFDSVVHFEISDEEALLRIEKRRIGEHRPEDSPEIAMKRLELYRDQTQPAAEYLKGRVNFYLTVNACQLRETIHSQLRRSMSI